MIQKNYVKPHGYIQKETVIIITGDRAFRPKTHIYRKYSYLITGNFPRKIVSV
jgi:hypothetical protein